MDSVLSALSLVVVIVLLVVGYVFGLGSGRRRYANKTGGSPGAKPAVLQGRGPPVAGRVRFVRKPEVRIIEARGE
jgi:hypothetical protein